MLRIYNHTLFCRFPGGKRQRRQGPSAEEFRRFRVFSEKSNVLFSFVTRLSTSNPIMPHGSKRTKSSSRASGMSVFGTSSKRDSQPRLVIATDICFWSTLAAVSIGFGGRMASGQVALVVGASITAFCWMLHQLRSRESRYTWTGSEWLWLAGILVGVAQIVPLPGNLLTMISPRIKDVLPLWFDNEFPDIFPRHWNQLSLAPWETVSGLATFVSYALLFLVAAQRLRRLKDVEQTLCLVSIAAVAMMLFAQLQFLTSNGKFFWYYEHPFMNTDSYPLGCFTNRNHLSQFLALGTAPLIWWLFRRLQQQDQGYSQQRGIAVPMHLIAVSALLVGIAGIALTVLMTLSRGGLLAIALTSFVAVGLMCRVGLASMKIGLALVLVGAVIAGLFSYSKYESILASRLEQNSGRIEIWNANIQVARDFPILGTGIGTHADAYQLRIETREDDGREYSHAESGYLQVASESGLAGLVVALLLIGTSFWWCLGSMRNSDTSVTSAAAAILASLVANVAHAIGDFFWYTPACVLLLLIQLACATRLYRLTRTDAGQQMFSFPLPRVVTAIAMCALIPVTLLMVDLKAPALLAEPHRMESILLSKAAEDESNADDKASTNLNRIKETILAGKLDPRDAKLQEAAATAYVQLFDLKQEHAENAMAASMLRDAVKGSQFNTVDDANEWLNRAIGGNMKLLRLALGAVRRSLANCPLRAKSYVLLTDLCFLIRNDDAKFQSKCLEQALKLRPHDSETLYLVGKAGLQEGDMDKALIYWRQAFDRSPRMQQRIAELLAPQMSVEFFEKEFHPNWKSLEVIGQAFAKAGREAESRQVLRDYIRLGMSQVKSIKTDEELESTLVSIRNRCRDIGDIRSAAHVLTYAVKRLPHRYPIRYMLSLDLIQSERPAEAAEHLKWCTAQNPDDANLRKLAAMAVGERLKKSPSSAKRDTDIEQTGNRR